MLRSFLRPHPCKPLAVVGSILPILWASHTFSANLSVKALSGGRYQIVGTQNTSTQKCPSDSIACNYGIAGVFTERPVNGGTFRHFEKYIYAGRIVGGKDPSGYGPQYSSVQFGSIRSASDLQYKSSLAKESIYKLDPNRHPSGATVCVSQWLGNIHNVDGYKVHGTDNGSCTYVSQNYASCETLTTSPTITMPPINVTDLPPAAGGHSGVYGDTTIGIKCEKDTNAIIAFTGITGSNAYLFDTKTGEGRAKDVAYYLYMNENPIKNNTFQDITGLKYGINEIPVKAEYSRTGKTAPTGGLAETSLTFNITYQ